MTAHRVAGWLLLAAGLAQAGTAPGAEPGEFRFDGVERVVAVGDVHGEHDALARMLRRAGVVDGNLAWSGGATHLVVAGDMVDRGPDSRGVLDLVMRLEAEAEADGGRVHALLGNHEAMWLAGDFEYASSGDFDAFAADETAEMRDAARERFEALRSAGQVQGEFDKLFPPGSLALRRALKPDGTYGRWLLGRPVAVVINDTAFVHGGISDAYAGASAADLNRRAREELENLLDAWNELAAAGILSPDFPLLDAARALAPHVESGAFDRHPAALRAAARTLAGATDSILFDPDGPLWYRGNADCSALIEADVVDRALDSLGAETLVISHTPQEDGRIAARLDGRVIRLDTGESVALLVMDAGQRHVLYPDEPDPAPVTVRRAHPTASLPMDADALEAFLAGARVVHDEEVGAGVTRPRRLTLEKDGVRLRAIFKSEATRLRGTGRLQSRQLVNISDRWNHEVAAYRLDRLLGLDMVPVTVQREIRGQAGALQYWVEDGITELKRRRESIQPQPLCPMQGQYDALELFDRLIYNTDRTQENILYTRDWRVILIDHTRAFRTHDGRPDGVRHVEPGAVPEFFRRLASLDDGNLKSAVGQHLDAHQFRALLARRDEMLAEWRKQ